MGLLIRTWKDVALSPLLLLACSLAAIGAVLEVAGQKIFGQSLEIARAMDRWTGRGAK